MTVADRAGPRIRGEVSHGRAVGGAALTLGALGVVYGDIGTSPLYSLREAFAHYEVEVVKGTAFGAASLVFWVMTVVISVKYLIFVLRADNKGEGGILALSSLVSPIRHRIDSRLLGIVALLGFFGTALLYGDGILTPAISVLSAVEGLKVATPVFEDWVVPITLVILVGLFAVQRRGTGAVGRVFGPVMVLWFGVLGVLGITQIVRSPDVLQALNPVWALRYFGDGGWNAVRSLGAIFLVVTGGEALYADMGHFGKRPIRQGWFYLVYPALTLVYFGQAAMVLGDPETLRSPLYLMGPSWGVIPLTVLATSASIIASQALISGVFSLTVQAVQLDLMPRVKISHTSAQHAGQVYVPIVNWLVMAGCLGLVLGFQTSSNLASAYGLAITALMAITTIIFGAVAYHRWGWPLWLALPFTAVFLAIDLSFLFATLEKVPQGGWFALVVGASLLLLMTTWRRGRELVAERMHRAEVPLSEYVADLAGRELVRPAGTAVYLFKTRGATPPALIANIEHNKALHQQVVLLSVEVPEVPTVDADQRVAVEDLGDGLYQVVARYGFMEEPDVPVALAGISHPGLRIDPSSTSFFLGRETVIATAGPGMAPWRERLFALMNRSAASAARFFRLPTDRVFEVGAQVEI